MISNSLLRTNNDENKRVSYLINKLSAFKKDFICECFITLAKFDFRKEFLKWFMEVKIDLDSSDGVEKVAEVEKAIK